MKKNYVFAGIIILVIIVAAISLYVLQNRKSSEENQKVDEGQNNALESNEKVDEPSVETIDLKPVNNRGGSGTANRNYNGTNFVHLIVAQLDKPAAGKFYEGWLVKNGPEPKYLSTGRLEKNGTEYALLFTNKTDYPGYNGVVITEETERPGLDGKPEDHVLEGSF